ncbi:hypothetical protein PENSPDRAFT_185675 [Peniophora sp. CONT]|nr:hypothetical protein PENSPDRAFT_185675 [Peniophora sp. CONT]
MLAFHPTSAFVVLHRALSTSVDPTLLISHCPTFLAYLTASIMSSEADRPTTPATPPRFKYLPEGRPWPTAYWPGIGDFIVITIDPVASVGHLDKVARRAARKLPKHRFVALAMSIYGLPIETKPFTHYLVALVRRGLPTVNNPPWSSPDMCYPISPYTYHPTRSETIQPIHPFPLANCYIDMTSALLDPICCRITTSPHDYTPVLPMSAKQLSRLRRLFSREVVHFEDLVERLKRGDLEVIASLPLPSSPVSASEVPLPSSLPPSLSDRNASSDRASVSSDDSASSISSPAIKQITPEEVSMIGSDDSISVVSDHDTGDELGSEDADHQLFEMMRFETMMNDTGDPRDPVVHVSYDLDEVDEITDPLLFIKVRDQLLS